MSVRVLYDREQGFACLYDSVTETAFGPLFRSSIIGGVDPRVVANGFLDWLEIQDDRDPRMMRGKELEEYATLFRDPTYVPGEAE